MSDGQDDKIPESPGDRLEKQRYFLELAIDRAKSQMDAPGSPNKTLEAVQKIVEAAGGMKATKFGTMQMGDVKPTPFMDALSRVNEVLKPKLDRDAAQRREWREEWEAGQIEAPPSVPGDPAPLGAPRRRKPVMSPEEIQRLRLYRLDLLAKYKAATGHSSRQIFEEAPSRNLHTCHKQKFHLWQKGELPSDSAPSITLERFLKLLAPIRGAKTKRKRIAD